MYAVEFKSIPHDGVVDIPANLNNWNGRPVRVILLADEALPATDIPGKFAAISLKTQGFHFDREEANVR